MTMHNECTVHCTCMTTRNADQTRPDQTRPDPFFSYLPASNRFLTASTTEGDRDLVENALEAKTKANDLAPWPTFVAEQVRAMEEHRRAALRGETA